MKRRGEKYALLWPKKAEFVRMACRFGATIIPFAAIGAEDSVNIVRDGAELSRAPVIGELLKQQVWGVGVGVCGCERVRKAGLRLQCV